MALLISSYRGPQSENPHPKVNINTLATASPSQGFETKQSQQGPVRVTRTAFILGGEEIALPEKETESRTRIICATFSCWKGAVRTAGTESTVRCCWRLQNTMTDSHLLLLQGSTAHVLLTSS